MEFSELKQFLSVPRKVFITMHAKPDGDALGSSLALYHYLLIKGHEPVVVSPTDFGMYLHWMPGAAGVFDYLANKEKVAKMIKDSGILFCLDFNSYDRTEQMSGLLRNFSGPKVMIDHHLDPEGFEDFRMWTPDACATAELIYEFIRRMGDEELVDKNIGTCIYTGLVTDSGSFRYSNVSPSVHRIVARLLEAGVDHTTIHRKLFDTFSELRMRFFGHCITNKLVILHEYRAAYISVSREELKHYEIKTGETEGLVNYPMNIDEVVFVALIIEREGIIKLSLRSKGDFPANEFAARYFEGGGHANAAGGSSKKSLKETVDLFLEGVREYKTLLQTV